MMNESRGEAIKESLAAAEETVIHPLAMRAVDASGNVHEALAINEVSLFRQTYQVARLRVLVDRKERLAHLDADGIMGATPAAPAAPNPSAPGPDIPARAARTAPLPIPP